MENRCKRINIDDRKITLREQIRLLLLRLLAHLPSPIPQHPTSNIQHPTSILIIRPDHLGDLLFLTPALRVLREALPEARLTALIGPWAKPILENNPYLDEILTCEFPGFTRRPKPSLFQPYSLLWREAKKLRERSFDCAVIFRFDHWWGAMMAYLAGVKRRVGYDISEVAPFLTEAVPYVPGRHEVEQNLTLVEKLLSKPLRRPFSPGSCPLEFSIAWRDEAFAEGYLAERGVQEGETLVCIHPGAGSPVKLWREEGWARVASALAERFSAKVLLSGSAQEEPMLERIARGARTLLESQEAGPILTTGKLDLGKLAAIMARSRLVLGVDSGPLHLAVAVGAPSVHLYGPEDPRAFGPWGDPAQHVVIAAERDCVPCNRLDYTLDELDAHPCVRDIPIEKVLEASFRLMGGTARV
ncbi:MAG: glycosyltransferase family 9 protein [Anaerolineae bacterium]